MKYYVIATHWDYNIKARVKYIVGQFEEYTNAVLFKTAYNEHYEGDAKIVDDFEMLNA